MAMRPAVAAIIALLVLVVGTFMGVAALLVLPLAGAVVLVALLVWLLQRRAANKPPVP
jgi:hypothetical protein